MIDLIMVGGQMNKMVCIYCRKSIDEDSSFCKYCGAGVILNNADRHKEEKLATIFQSVYRTLQTCSEYSEKEFEEKFEPFKSYVNKILSNNDYYRLLVDIIFYSGFRASTVDKYLEVSINKGAIRR
jgi:DNA-3-methyladenine glycosylase I